MSIEQTCHKCFDWQKVHVFVCLICMLCLWVFLYYLLKLKNTVTVSKAFKGNHTESSQIIRKRKIYLILVSIQLLYH